MIMQLVSTNNNYLYDLNKLYASACEDFFLSDVLLLNHRNLQVS